MKIVFDFSAEHIEIEGDGPELVQLLQLVRDVAPKLPSISILTQPSKNGNGTPAATRNSVGSGEQPPPGTMTLRQFVKSLEYQNISEKITAIAYYQKHHGNRQSFAPREMDEWFMQCGMQKPSQMPVALFDAKKRYGYTDKAGHGQWRISSQGENLIVGKVEEKATSGSQEQ